jgi:hypothetical protein
VGGKFAVASHLNHPPGGDLEKAGDYELVNERFESFVAGLLVAVFDRRRRNWHNRE